MKTLSIDIETFSPEPLAKCGVYRYCQARSLKCCCSAIPWTAAPSRWWISPPANASPADVLAALTDPGCVQVGLQCPVRAGVSLPVPGVPCRTIPWTPTPGTAPWCGRLPWACPSLWRGGRRAGPGEAEAQGGQRPGALFLHAGKKARDGSTFRRLPADAPEKWAAFKAYNLRDVETEMSIQQKLSQFPVSPEEWENYHLDQRINDRGILLDRTLVAQAIRCDERFKRTHLEQARSVTGLENPNSPAQLKAWLAEKGVEADSLSKASVLELLSQAEGEVELALSLRQELAKSSVKKYTAMESVVCPDDRARGLIQFYGANRTGRFAGRLIQVQNLPQNHLPDLKQARTLVRDGSI